MTEEELGLPWEISAAILEEIEETIGRLQQRGRVTGKRGNQDSGGVGRWRR